MRALLCILLLSPALALASVYKCVVGDKTTYSQLPCGKNAQEVQNQIIVVPARKMPEDKSPARAPGGTAPAANATPAANAAPARQNASAATATAEPGSDCKARMQRYLDAQDCFNRFRRKGGAFTGDTSECTDVPYPNDCTTP